VIDLHEWCGCGDSDLDVFKHEPSTSGGASEYHVSGVIDDRGMDAHECDALGSAYSVFAR